MRKVSRKVRRGEKLINKMLEVKIMQMKIFSTHLKRKEKERERKIAHENGKSLL
jgi:hypothetical protein